ncbi:MAG: hypothetical protein LBD24_09425 [Spirochaetaceae bacterium]|jgi:hypothetical protein|nr:hypothetical protein [Spirochaetaceae bacterium]
MKHIVQLVLGISLCFAVVFVLSLVLKLLQIRIESVRAIPVLSRLSIEECITAARVAFPVTIYFSILLGISYTARRGIPVPASIICLVILGMGAALLIALGINALERIPPDSSPPQGITLGEPGLIFSHPPHKTRVFLQDPGSPQGSQVVAEPDRPLRYEKSPSRFDGLGTAQGFGFSPTLLQSNTYFFLQSILSDIDRAAAQFSRRFKEGFMLFFLYMLSLVFLLSSCRFIMDLSVWPLANLFLGILAFRGVLALEKILNSEETQSLLASFMGDRFPQGVLSPLAFGCLGAVIILYTALARLGKSRRMIDEDF